jgi:hypothetical protein
MMYERHYGSKYDGSLDVKEIAKLVRADIKQAVKDGTLPGAPVKYSVRIERFSMGQAINIRIKNWPGPTTLPQDFTHDKYGAFQGLTPEANAAKATLQAILDAYNHDGSDVQSDYFDVNFYGGAEFDWQTTPKQTVGVINGVEIPLGEDGQPVHPRTIARLVEASQVPVDQYDSNCVLCQLGLEHDGEVAR